MILLDILSLVAKSSAENRTKSSAYIICKAFNCDILLRPIPFILSSSVNRLLGVGGGWIGFPSTLVSMGSAGATILYFLGRAEYPEAMKNKPNNRRTIRNATGIKVTPQKGIMQAARMKQMIPKK